MPADVAPDGALLKMEKVAPTGDPVGRLTLTNYGPQADKLRRDLAVSQVVCVAMPK